MDELLFLKIIDWVKDYGLQVIGLIIIIFLSKFFIQAILWILNLAIKVVLGFIHIIFVIIRFTLTIIPSVIHDKMNKFIVRVESLIRNMENINRRVKSWFGVAPQNYEKIHVNIVKLIKSAAVLFVVISALVLVINVFFQKSLTIEQILIHITS
ncbi:hypothetical protein QUH71_26435 (plasmid) [Priestia aryabhattai]|uniref:hypothetical protein n=1 Tax=Priestia aryabhattai TaxID=412384 RepID=UPI0025A375AF|nr:hypothetical protein [Priestia aryabhattai]WJN47507.1 hypothetical protein QUH71_26435 [Priestia aryabhattai]